MGQQCRPNIRTRAFSAGSDGQWVSGPGSANFRSPQINGLEIKDRESKRLSGRPTSRLAALHSDYLQAGKPLASSFQLFLDSDRNHVVICSLTLSHQPGHPPLPPRYFAARAFSFTSFTSFASLTSSKSFTIRTSMTPLPQVLYNPHLQAPLGSAGNKGLITPLESALTKNSPVSPVESALTKTGGWGPSRRSFWLVPPLVCRRFDLANANAQSSRVGRVFRTSAALGRWTTGSSLRIRPSRKTSTRFAYCAMSCSCVTSTMVNPLSFKLVLSAPERCASSSPIATPTCCDAVGLCADKGREMAR